MTLGLVPAATAPPAVQAIAPVAPAARPAPPVPEPPRYIAAYLNNPPPAYPAAARRRGHEGRVLVRAEVLADGRCNQVMLKASSGHDLLDRAAMDAVQQWRFVPARQGDQAVDAWVDVPITFKLND
jgi:protein TonB